MNTTLRTRLLSAVLLPLVAAGVMFVVVLEMAAVERATRMMLYLGYLVCGAVAVVGVYRVADAVSGKLALMAGAIRRVVEGDLSAQPPTGGASAEVVALGVEVRRIIDGTREQMTALTELSGALTERASRIAASTSQLASASSEQAASISEATSTAEEIKQTGQAAKTDATRIVEMAEKSVEVSTKGRASTEKSVQALERIRRQVDTIAGGIESLREKVGEVDEIILSVNEIAEQSNLLAVNASIEASKAGEYGKGFAVVAQEIRSLSEQSKQATTKVRETLGSIQSAIEGVVMSATSGREAADEGSRVMKHTGEIIQGLAEVIAETAEAAQGIAINANQQVVGLEQMAQAMININQSALENQRATSDVERTSESFAAMADEVSRLVINYQLEA